MSELFPDFHSANSLITYFGAVGIESILFLICLGFCFALIFKPALKLMHSRLEATEGLEKKARDLEETNRKLKEAYERQIDGARQLADEHLDTTEMIGKKRSEMIIGTTKRSVLSDRDNVLKAFEDNKAVLRQVAEKNISVFGSEIVDKITNG